jgi:5-carboxymethyl-2-hydroxymuconate isomerase
LSIEKINKSVNNKKHLFNNLNDFIIKIDYFDQKGIRKRKNRLPLYYILNSKNTNNQISV